MSIHDVGGFEIPVPSDMRRSRRAFGDRGVEAALVAIGLSRARVYARDRPKFRGRMTWMGGRYSSFWTRNEAELEFIAVEAREAYRDSVKRVRPDLLENKDEGQALLRAWERVKKSFAKHGVEV